MADRLQQRRAGVILALLGLLIVGGAVLRVLTTDALSNPPPAGGAFGYNTFVPPNTPGASYVDPVLGWTVRRLTTDHLTDDIYARNMWWNADATKFLHLDKTINTATGAVTHTGIPSGLFAFDRGFDPVDPDVLFYFSGSTVKQLTLHPDGTMTDTIYYTAPATLKSLGGSINWLDVSGHYMVLRYGVEPSVHLFDRQNLLLGPYANAVSGTEVEAGAYIGLTPDGAFIVGGRRSWRINHSTRAVAASGTYYWDLCGDHGSFVSASDGRNYKVTSNCSDLNEFWRVDITNDAESIQHNAAAQKVLPHNQRLLSVPSWSFAQHVSTVAKGPFRDWAFCSTEDVTDRFNGGVTPWLPYKSEIVGVNVLTGEVRRLVQHRSRSVDGDYGNQPRVSSSWGGELVGFASNFNQRGVIDTFAIPFAVVPPTATTAAVKLRVTP